MGVQIEAVECSGPAACPHSCFQQKHYCEFCVTPDMAADHCAGRWVASSILLMILCSTLYRVHILYTLNHLLKGSLHQTEHGVWGDLQI